MAVETSIIQKPLVKLVGILIGIFGSNLTYFVCVEKVRSECDSSLGLWCICACACVCVCGMSMGQGWVTRRVGLNSSLHAACHRVFNLRLEIWLPEIYLHRRLQGPSACSWRWYRNQLLDISYRGRVDSVDKRALRVPRFCLPDQELILHIVTR